VKTYTISNRSPFTGLYYIGTQDAPQLFSADTLAQALMTLLRIMRSP